MKCRECADDRLHGVLCTVCYGSGVTQYIPIPNDPWNLITENLYQGSAAHMIWEWEFESVYTLCGIRDTGPAPGIPHRRLLIPDDIGGAPLTPDQFHSVTDMVTHVTMDLDARKKVLVRCRAGLNRSGLVVALVLVRQGMSTRDAIKLVREKRSPWALCNENFVHAILELA